MKRRGNNKRLDRLTRSAYSLVMYYAAADCVDPPPELCDMLWQRLRRRVAECSLLRCGLSVSYLMSVDTDVMWFRAVYREHKEAAWTRQ